MTTKPPRESQTTPTGNASNAPKRGRRVESTFADKWDPINAGDALEGRYMGSEWAPGKDHGEMFRVYHIVGEDQKRWSIAGAHLDSIMPQIPRGTYVWVTYEGEEMLRNRNKMKKFGVELEEGVKLIDTYAEKSEKPPQ